MPNKEISYLYQNKQAVLLEVSQPLRVKCNGEEYEISSNNMMLGQSFELLNTNLDCVKINRIVLDHCFLNITNKVFFIDSYHFSTVFNILKYPQEVDLQGIFKVEEKIQSLLHSLIEMNSDYIDIDNKNELNEQSASGKIDKRLIIVHRYIRDHHDLPLTLQILADLIDCNPVYLSNTYSKIFKISPMKSLQKIRMKKAREFLSYTNISVKEITIRIGYISNSQFSSIFKKYFSCTPAEYRRHARTNNLKKRVEIINE